MTPKWVPERLLGHRRYFAGGIAKRDHAGLYPLVLFVFESVEAEQTFVEVAATLDHAPSSAPTPRCSPGKESWASHGACRPRSRPHDGSCTTSAVQSGLSKLPHPPEPSVSCRGRPPPHSLSKQVSTSERRSAPGMLLPRDGAVRLLSSRTFLSGHLIATVGKLLQNAAAFDQRCRGPFSAIEKHASMPWRRSAREFPSELGNNV